MNKIHCGFAGGIGFQPKMINPMCRMNPEKLRFGKSHSGTC